MASALTGGYQLAFLVAAGLIGVASCSRPSCCARIPRSASASTSTPTPVASSSPSPRSRNAGGGRPVAVAAGAG